ncbi:MAG TPA: hypothetical protein VIU64_06555 [Polyangia bacterium]
MTSAELTDGYRIAITAASLAAAARIPTVLPVAAALVARVVIDVAIEASRGPARPVAVLLFALWPLPVALLLAPRRRTLITACFSLWAGAVVVSRPKLECAGWYLAAHQATRLALLPILLWARCSTARPWNLSRRVGAVLATGHVIGVVVGAWGSWGVIQAWSCLVMTAVAGELAAVCLRVERPS